MCMEHDSLDLEKLCDQLILCNSENTEILSKARCGMDVLSRDLQTWFAQEGTIVKIKVKTPIGITEWDKKDFCKYLCGLIDGGSKCSYGIKKHFSFALEPDQTSLDGKVE